MIIDNLSANPDGSISLSEAHPEKLLERIIKLEQRVKLLESIQANIAINIEDLIELAERRKK